MRGALLASGLLLTSAAAAEEVVTWERLPSESFHRGAHPSLAKACGEVSTAVVRKLKLEDVSDCEVSAYGRGAQRLFVVTLGHGPVSDCPSGCVQDQASAIVRGPSIVAVPTTLVALESPYRYVREILLTALRDAGTPGVDDPYPRDFDFYMEEGFCANRHDKVLLRSRGPSVYWAIEIPRTSCEAKKRAGVVPQVVRALTIEGEIRIPVTGAAGYPKPDFSKVTVKVLERAPQK